jgi:uncharacterized repeat protein (TIGR01451 family)
MLKPVISGINKYLLPTTFLVFSGLLYAQPQLSLELSSATQITTEQQGKVITTYETTDTTVPGDKLAYTIAFHNTCDEAAVNASLVGTIPEQATFLKTLIVPAQTTVRFSIDNGNSYHLPPLTTTVVNAKGETVTQEVGADAYTHIRFTLRAPIAPEASGSLSYLIQIK